MNKRTVALMTIVVSSVGLFAGCGGHKIVKDTPSQQNVQQSQSTNTQNTDTQVQNQNNNQTTNLKNSDISSTKKTTTDTTKNDTGFIDYDSNTCDDLPVTKTSLMFYSLSHNRVDDYISNFNDNTKNERASIQAKMNNIQSSGITDIKLVRYKSSKISSTKEVVTAELKYIGKNDVSLLQHMRLTWQKVGEDWFVVSYEMEK